MPKKRFVVLNNFCKVAIAIGNAVVFKADRYRIHSLKIVAHPFGKKGFLISILTTYSLVDMLKLIVFNVTGLSRFGIFRT